MMTKKLTAEIGNLEKNIFSELNSMNLEKFLLDSIKEDYFTRKINDEMEIDIFFPNECFSHKVSFRSLNFVNVISFEIEFSFKYKDIKQILILEVGTSKSEEFIAILKLNYDFSLWDIEYLTK